MIESTGVGPPASVIDVGGGLSVLGNMLLDRGDYEIWLLDISAVALVTARERLGERAGRARFIHADIARAELPKAHFDVWHDRAVFHFLTDPRDRQRYVEAALSAVKPGGHLLIATFAIDGPASCSGLPVMRYDANTLASCFARGATVCRTEIEEHRTPAGGTQRFVYCLMRRRDRGNPR
jgi:SAM-dependent methyltransferase